MHSDFSLNILLLFLTFSALVANPKKLLYTVANPARGLLNREKKKKKKSGSARIICTENVTAVRYTLQRQATDVFSSHDCIFHVEQVPTD